MFFAFASFARPLFRLVVYYLGLMSACYSAPVHAEIPVWVLQSHDGPPYQQALSGFKEKLATARRDAVYTLFNLNDAASVTQFLQRLAIDAPRLILTLGTPATRFAQQHATATPIVASLIIDKTSLKASPWVTGVTLHFAADLQWQWLRRLLPDAETIAVLYDSKQPEDFDAVQKQALASAVTLIPIAIEDLQQLPRFIEALPRQLDALWIMQGGAYNMAAIRELLLYSFRHRVPLIGLSAQWVKAGALYALDWDYHDLGAQAAELAIEILSKNVSPDALPLYAPRKVRSIVNLKTAEHMKLSLDARVMSDIAEVLQ